MRHVTNSISGLVRRATFLVFAFAIVIGSLTFYFFFNAATMRHVEDEARTLLGLAMASRSYTINNITPLLEQLPEDEFNAEQVPSFAAQMLFQNLITEESNYT